MNQSIEQNAFVEQILTKRQHFFLEPLTLIIGKTSHTHIIQSF